MTTVAVLVSFLNEERYLPELLASMHSQTRPPDRLMLIDDGSTDASHAIAADFAEGHSYATVLRRPKRAAETDRLARAAELVSFEWGLQRLNGDYDIIAKLDADLRLAPDHIAHLVEQFERNPRLGLAGGFLARPLPDGGHERERVPQSHIRGPNKFYRRACLEEIAPIPAHLGWDHIDEIKARMNGWHAQSFAIPSGDSVHLRPTGSHDGRLRGYRRWGECAWGYGAHPIAVLYGTALRLSHRPLALAGLNYLYGWLRAAALRRPRAERHVRAAVRREQLARLRASAALGRAGS